MRLLDELRWAYCKKFPNRWYERGDLVKITIGNDFEPNGRASETFEDYYILDLLLVPYWYSLSNGKWVKGKDGLRMTFHSAEFEMVVRRAINFINNIPQEIAKEMMKEMSEFKF